jgi:hypothetical protein
MCEDVFFWPDWLESDIHFFQPVPSSWTLVEKLSERNIQLNAEEYRAFDSPSAAWALYHCREVTNPKNAAIMKIYKQYGLLWDILRSLLLSLFSS